MNAVELRKGTYLIALQGPIRKLAWLFRPHWSREFSGEAAEKKFRSSPAHPPSPVRTHDDETPRIQANTPVEHET